MNTERHRIEDRDRALAFLDEPGPGCDHDFPTRAIAESEACVACGAIVQPSAFRTAALELLEAVEDWAKHPDWDSPHEALAAARALRQVVGTP